MHPARFVTVCCLYSGAVFLLTQILLYPSSLLVFLQRNSAIPSLVMRNGDSVVRPRDARRGTYLISAAAFGGHANQQSQIHAFTSIAGRFEPPEPCATNGLSGRPSVAQGTRLISRLVQHQGLVHKVGVAQGSDLSRG